MVFGYVLCWPFPYLKGWGDETFLVYVLATLLAAAYLNKKMSPPSSFGAFCSIAVYYALIFLLVIYWEAPRPGFRFAGLALFGAVLFVLTTPNFLRKRLIYVTTILAGFFTLVIAWSPIREEFHVLFRRTGLKTLNLALNHRIDQSAMRLIRKEAYPTPEMFLDAIADDQGGFWFAGKSGKIYKSGVPLRENGFEVVLDLSDEVSQVDERGLYQLELSPGGSSKQKYLYYSYATASTNAVGRVPVDAGGFLNKSKREVILSIPDRDNLHNGGALRFGSDGYLYFSVGDDMRQQSGLNFSNELFGSIIRIDVEGVSPNSVVPPPFVEKGSIANYRIPSDNPFIDSEKVRPEIFAAGFRNVYSLAFDVLTNRLLAQDVGSNLIEEVNEVEAGYFYGWPYKEGKIVNVHHTRKLNANRLPSSIDSLAKELGFKGDSNPVFSYAHKGRRVCIVGGRFVNSGSYPAFDRQYLFGDFGSGEIFVMADKNKVSAIADGLQEAGMLLGIFAIDNQLFASEFSAKGAFLVRLHQSASAEERTPHQNIAMPKSSQTTGSVVYAERCASCHDITVKRFRDKVWQQSRTDDAIMGVIRDGGAAHGLSAAMQPWGEILSDDEISALVKHIRALGQEHDSGI